MIRDTIPADIDDLCQLADETSVFKSHEIVALREVLTDFFEDNDADADHHCVTQTDGEKAVGFAYFAQAAMTDKTWHIWWIAINKKLHGKGFGKQLMDYIESTVRDRKGRILLIETSSLPHYEATRRSYEKRGYKKASVIPDYYSDGDDMVTYGKRMTD